MSALTVALRQERLAQFNREQTTSESCVHLLVQVTYWFKPVGRACLLTSDAKHLDNHRVKMNTGYDHRQVVCVE